MRLLILFLAACLAVFAVDVLAGPQVSPWALYLLPILAAGWLLGARSSLVLATIASALVIAAALIAGHPFDNWWEFMLSWANRTVSLLAAAWLVSLASSAAQRRSFDETLEHQE